MARDHRTDDAFRREVCDWFRANGVDTSRLPLDPDASITNGQLTFRRHVLSELTGSPMPDPDMPNRLTTETITVPLVVAPPSDIADWLGPSRCPVCGQ